MVKLERNGCKHKWYGARHWNLRRIIFFLSVFLLLVSWDGEVLAGARKKIRIHVPQKIKHIHHHKKVYIMQHPTTIPVPVPTPYSGVAGLNQYAPAFLSTEAVPLSLVPFSDQVSSPSPNLQPQYRARGHYGPPSVYKIKNAKRGPKTQTSNNGKRYKFVQVSDSHKKRGHKKYRSKPKEVRHTDDDSSIENNDYFSELNSSPNTYKNARKPKRVQKYVDSDGEHVHTYTEEHIHQYVYDDPPIGKPEEFEAIAMSQSPSIYYSKHGGRPPPHALMPFDLALHHAMADQRWPETPTDAIISSEIIPSPHTIRNFMHPLHKPSNILRPLITAPTLSYPSIVTYPQLSSDISPSYSSPTTAILPSSLSADSSLLSHQIKNEPIPSKENTHYGSMGSMGTPPHMEYVDYYPDEATHDHQYHDHGEIVQDLGLSNPIREKQHFKTYHLSNHRNKFQNSQNDQDFNEKNPTFTLTDEEEQMFKTNPYLKNISKKPHFNKTPKHSHSFQDEYKHVPHFSYTYFTKDEKKKKNLPSFEDSEGINQHTSSTFFGKQENKRKLKPKPTTSYLHHYPTKPTLSLNHPLEYQHYPVESMRLSIIDNKPYNKFKTSGRFKPYSTTATLFDDNVYNGFRGVFDTRHSKPAKPLSEIDLYNAYKDAFEKNPTTIGISVSKQKEYEARPLKIYERYNPNSNSDEQLPPAKLWQKKNKSKGKSVSSQSISFEGQDHKTIIDHYVDSSNNYETIDKSMVSISSTDDLSSNHNLQNHPTDLEYSPDNNYYSIIAPNPIVSSSGISEDSTHNIQIVDAPNFKEPVPVTESNQIEYETTVLPPTTLAPIVVVAAEAPRRPRKKAFVRKYQINVKPTKSMTFDNNTSDRGLFRYGDKLMSSQ